jgi:hypothetical protein
LLPCKFFLRINFHLSFSNLLSSHQTRFGLSQFHEQLFQAQDARLSQSNCQEHEKDRVNNQAIDIEDLLFDFDKRGQLIIVHHHAEGKVDPTHHSGLSRLSLHPSQLNNVEDILGDEDTY